MAKSIVCDLIQIFKSSVSAVLPVSLIRSSVKYNSFKQQLTICGDQYNLTNKNVYVVGTGKAVQSMAVELENILHQKIKQGIVSIPEGSLNSKSDIIMYHEGAKNNLPDKNSEETSRKIKNLVIGLTKEDLLIVLISGGGSALLSLPKPPITLEEKTKLVKQLANAGADIKELNTVRKKISDIKGGKLAEYANPAQVVSLILSDIVGDPIDLIASGPTVPNKDDPSQAHKIINKYNLGKDLPESIIESNDKPRHIPEENVTNYVIGSNKLSINTAADKARSLDYLPITLTNTVTGNVTYVAKDYKEITESFCRFLNGQISEDILKSKIQALNVIDKDINLCNANKLKNKDICLIFGGEITVEVKGTGKGGRNQHLALEFSKRLNESKEAFKGYEIFILSAGTDGIDGPTDAAGAIGHLNLVPSAKEQGLDVDKYLINNDSYNFYKKLDSGNLHVITGHTGTNVMDLHLIIIKKSQEN